MWISARTATTLAAAAFLLIMIAMAAPLLPKPHLPALPKERAAVKAAKGTPTSKFGAATAALSAPERVRAQRMAECASSVVGAARLGDRSGSGPAVRPSEETVSRLLSLLRDARTVADPRALKSEPEWVVRLVRGEHKVDVMADPKADRLVVALDGTPVGSYGTVALHREFSALGDALFASRS